VRQFVLGDLCVDAGVVYARDSDTGERLDLPVDLTARVEAELEARSCHVSSRAVRSPFPHHDARDG